MNFQQDLLDALSAYDGNAFTVTDNLLGFIGEFEPQDTTPEQQHEINKTDLKEMAEYYGGWDELRKVIYDIEGDEAEASYDSFVNEFYGSDKPVTMKEQHEEAYKTKYLLKNF